MKLQLWDRWWGKWRRYSVLVAFLHRLPIISAVNDYVNFSLTGLSDRFLLMFRATSLNPRQPMTMR